MAEATISSKNQIVIPREAREALQIKPGDKVLVTVLSNRVLVLEKRKPFTRRFGDGADLTLKTISRRNVEGT